MLVAEYLKLNQIKFTAHHIAQIYSGELNWTGYRAGKLL